MQMPVAEKGDRRADHPVLRIGAGHIVTGMRERPQQRRIHQVLAGRHAPDAAEDGDRLLVLVEPVQLDHPQPVPVGGRPGRDTGIGDQCGGDRHHQASMPFPGAAFAFLVPPVTVRFRTAAAVTGDP
ncbi:MAG: hypothetical protein AUI10_07920 [Actinobacteria bacterium 13_2_20CM_2_72_6]|nr:MAG: hypothetical protein AUI10_07920 [Actinobacteria bacterium 13_2_20CM_2_72_6]